MNKTEATEATAAIGMMLKAFPSSQSTITADSARVYLFAVEDLPLEAVKRACRSFVRGEVQGRNHSFAPSAPELAQVAKEQEGKIRIETFEANHQFVIEGSELWQRMLLLKQDKSYPTFQRDGKRGWHFTHAEVAEAGQLALPAPISEAQQAATRARIAATLGVKFDLGDPDAETGDMGSRGAA
jgi:hypothetical protein